MNFIHVYCLSVRFSHINMHGRLKIKTSAQQEEEKKKERKIKLAGYRAAMSKIISNRKEGVKDDSQLKLTGQVLVSNPDIHTLWNIRKECVTSKTEAIEEPSEKDSVWFKEVELTSQCLMTNPKSYGAWHHRQYSLEKMRLGLVKIYIFSKYICCVVPHHGSRSWRCVISS